MRRPDMNRYALVLLAALACVFAFPSLVDASVVPSKDYVYAPVLKPDLKPVRLDSDRDGLCDWIEKKLGTNPHRKDTDRDGLSDGFEDMNHNGVYEPHRGETNPLKWDSDSDGLSDSVEVANHLNPLRWDTDGDGLGDAHDDCPTDSTNSCVDYFVVEEVVVVFEEEVYEAVPDWDGDGVEDAIDPCPFDAFDYCIEDGVIVIEEDVVEVVDSDGDGAEDVYDPCPLDYYDTCLADEMVEVEEIEDVEDVVVE
jgi:hypothetical protein